MLAVIWSQSRLIELFYPSIIVGLMKRSYISSIARLLLGFLILVTLKIESSKMLFKNKSCAFVNRVIIFHIYRLTFKRNVRKCYRVSVQ